MEKCQYYHNLTDNKHYLLCKIKLPTTKKEGIGKNECLLHILFNCTEFYSFLDDKNVSPGEYSSLNNSIFNTFMFYYESESPG